MKNTIQKIGLILLLFPLFAMAGHGDWNGKITKEKKIEKTFSVTSDAMMRVSNQYGVVQIQSWDKPEIQVKVQIRVNGNDEKQLARYLEQITVDFSSSSSSVTAKTRMGFRSFSKTSLEINYLIFMPVNGKLNAENQYGDIRIDKLNGTSRIDIEYGSLDIGELWNDDNRITMRYSTGSQIDQLKKGKIQASYSGLSIKKSKFLDIEGSYTDFKFDEVETLKIESVYGGLIAEKIGEIVAKVDYFSSRIEQLYKKIGMEMDYGSLRIEKVLPTTKEVKIEADYGSIKIGYDPKWEFTIVAETDFTTLQTGGEIQFNKKNIDYSGGKYEGYHLNPNSENKIQIEADYGTVRVSENL